MNTHLGLYEILILNERKTILFHYDLANDQESDEAKIAQLEKTPRIQNLSGLVAALKELNKKFSPFQTQNAKYFKSTFYKFSLYDSPGGIKIILLTQNNEIDFCEALEDIFQKAYLEIAQRNPLYQSNTVIKNSQFTLKVKQIFSELNSAVQLRPI